MNKDLTPEYTPDTNTYVPPDSTPSQFQLPYSLSQSTGMETSYDSKMINQNPYYGYNPVSSVPPSSSQVNPAMIKKLEGVKIKAPNQPPIGESSDEKKVPKLSEYAFPILNFANTYYFDHGRYFLDNGVFWQRVDNGYSKMKIYEIGGCPHCFLYPIGGNKAISVAIETFKAQHGIA